MCTVSLLRTKDAYWLTSNRDEREDRPPAETPHIIEVDGVKTVFARDPVGGGTQVGVNEFGVSAVLLNDYTVPQADSGVTSRGQLVLSALQSQSVESAVNSLQSNGFSQFNGFRLLLCDEKTAVQLNWNRETITVSRPTVPTIVTSSGWDDDGAKKHRTAVFQEWHSGTNKLNWNSLMTLHRDQCAAAGQHNILMRNKYTHTVAIAAICVRWNNVEFYYDDSPWTGNGAYSTKTRLARQKVYG